MQGDPDEVDGSFPEVGVAAPLAIGLTVCIAISFAVIFVALPSAPRDDGILLFASLVLAAGLILLSYIDLRTGLLPDLLTVPLGLMGLGVSIYAGSWMVALVGGLIGYGLIAGLAAFWRAQRGYEGIGLGDAKLLAASGLWVGVFSIPLVLLIASGIGLIVALTVSKKTRRSSDQIAIPFGPFLAIGAWTAWCGSSLAFIN
jgi:leader peptidase (prepilin peptidase)/N-methyltransferase